MAEVYEIIKSAQTALIFVNTRFQAEFAFQRLWELNDEGLPIALHHGSLSAEQRRKVEAAMTRGELRAVVCTSTLDMGIDWGDVDLVIQLAAPKGASRMVQRIGRANHRLDEPSRALFVPASRFEMLECRAAADAILENHLDGEPVRIGTLDVLAQHIMGCACSEPFELTALYDEVRSAGPYAELSWEDFETVVDFVSTGGYALRTYDKFRRIVRNEDGLWTARNAQARQQHRMNVGAIVSPGMINIRIGGGQATHGRAQDRRGRGGLFRAADAGRHLHLRRPGVALQQPGRRRRLRQPRAERRSEDAQLGRLEVPALDLSGQSRAPDDARRARMDRPAPGRSGMAGLAEGPFGDPGRRRDAAGDLPRGKRFHMVCYPFEGRLAHTTLAMLLTRRLDRLGVGPLGFVCNDYALNMWSLRPMDDLDLDELFDQDMLGDDLEAWLDESFMMKRAFKHAALIAGLIERRHPGAEKSGRQVTFSTDLIYDVLRKHQPDHLMLRCARHDAATGMLDIARLGDMLAARARPYPPHAAGPRLAVRRADHAGDRPRARAGRRRRRNDPGRGRGRPDRRGHVVTRFSPSSCGGLRIALANVEVMLRWSGALWLERESTLVVADLHFEKGSSYAARFGQMLPPYDTRETLDRLDREIAPVARTADLPGRQLPRRRR
jgi:ATP-dependent Lhr-like helicase